MANYLETDGLDRFAHAANSRSSTYVTEGDAGFAAWVRETKHAGSLDDRVTVNEALEWLGGIGDEPFFLALNFQNSHVPYPIPPDFPRRFGPAQLDFTIRFARFPKDKTPVVQDVYADSLAYVDAQIGRLIRFLKAAKKWDNTLFVLTGDHGQAFYEHGFAAHASAIYDEVMRVPLILRAPGLGAAVVDRLAQHVDIAPTVIGLLGLPQHPSFQGIDLLATPPNQDRSVYMVAQTPDAYQYGIIRSGYKLIYDERQREHLLFDLRNDPAEKHNIAGFHPDLAKDLITRLDAWRKLQIDYYADSALHTREYPPILKD
jgi:arylsulfatase A-like enzyme